MTEWKPGTVAKATVRGIKDVVVLARAANSEIGGTDGWFSSQRIGPDCIFYGVDVTDIRPLVVLDPSDWPKGCRHEDDPAQVLSDWADAVHNDGRTAIEAALRWIGREVEAQVGRRIPEPGMWAVVVDCKGETWVRHEGDAWLNTQSGQDWPWSEIENPALVREGVAE